jgi:hypothetical protein
MRNVFLIAAAALLALPLAGCMPTGPSPEAIASAKAEILECYRTSKNNVAAAECQNAVLARVAPGGDLANVIATERVAIAEKVDAGKMTRAEGAAEFAKVFAAANTEATQRSAAIAASMPVSCTSVGTTTTCY